MHPQANGWTLLGCAFVLSASLPAPAPAQTADRIWGRVHTSEGRAHTGFIRWDRTRTSWADVLRGLKEVPEENYFAWLEAHGRERATRTIELRGYRITWNEVDPDFPMEVRTGVRFGHLDSLVVLEGERAELTLRAGRRLELVPRGGYGGRVSPRVVVEVPGEEEVELKWDELERVVFSAPPPTAVPRARRLWGTAEDHGGNRYTGQLAWDQDEILESDVLDGRERGRVRGERQLRFGRIRSLTPTGRGTRVEMSDGSILELEGRNDVDPNNRGLRIADPALGVVVVPWEHLRTVRFHEAAATSGERGGFSGGRLITGTVVTSEREELRGELRWDADEAGSWELLDGEADGIQYEIEFGFIRRIVPDGEDGARVTLVDGRTLETKGSRDVGAENKGVMVASTQRPEAQGGGQAWRLVPWSDVAEVRFDPEPAASGRPENP